MNAEELKKQVSTLETHILFSFHGKDCGIDPFSRENIDVWCGNNCKNAKSIDEVFTCDIFDGNCLKDIADEITDFSW